MSDSYSGKILEAVLLNKIVKIVIIERNLKSSEVFSVTNVKLLAKRNFVKKQNSDESSK